MSHLRPEDIAVGHKKSLCRKGRHRYGEGQSIGGGILRHVCLICGAVTIDLTAAESVDGGEPTHITNPKRRRST